MLVVYRPIEGLKGMVHFDGKFALTPFISRIYYARSIYLTLPLSQDSEAGSFLREWSLGTFSHLI